MQKQVLTGHASWSASPSMHGPGPWGSAHVPRAPEYVVESAHSTDMHCDPVPAGGVDGGEVTAGDGGGGDVTGGGDGGGREVIGGGDGGSGEASGGGDAGGGEAAGDGGGGEVTGDGGGGEVTGDGGGGEVTGGGNVDPMSPQGGTVRRIADAVASEKIGSRIQLPAAHAADSPADSNRASSTSSSGAICPPERLIPTIVPVPPALT
eukprot:scaffold1190_cov393-Prasinococcus_capsulatus_cf.AAC.22